MRTSTARLEAAAAGDLELLKQLVAEAEAAEGDSFSVFFQDELLDSALEAGHIHVAMWLKEKGCAWGDWPYSSAAAGGQLHVMQWLWQAQAVPWRDDNYSAWQLAALRGDTPMLSWLIEHTATPCEVCKFDGEELDTPSRQLFTAAAASGNIQAVQLLGQQQLDRPFNIPYDALAEGAAMGGHVHMLEWLRDQRPPSKWTANAYCKAIQLPDWQQRRTTLQWLRDNGCPWDPIVTGEAIIRHDLRVLRWLREQDPPCPYPSDAGRLCHPNGVEVAFADPSRMLVYLMLAGAPMSPEMSQAARVMYERHMQTYEYLRIHLDLPCPAAARIFEWGTFRKRSLDHARPSSLWS